MKEVKPYPIDDGVCVHFEAKSLDKVKSKYQTIEILENEEYGRMLFLDNQLQSSELDEYMYHELLCHPVLMMHPNPKSVLILGGGEGCTIREVLKHESVEQITMIDIDEMVLKACKRNKAFGYEYYSDPRVTILHQDALTYIRGDNKFDIIIADLPDPMWESNRAFFTKDFYQDILSNLNLDGLFVAQTGEGAVMSFETSLTIVNRTMREVFPYVDLYTDYIQTFFDEFSWMVASRNPIPEINVKELIASRNLTNKLSYLTPNAWKRACLIHESIQENLDRETRVWTR